MSSSPRGVDTESVAATTHFVGISRARVRADVIRDFTVDSVVVVAAPALSGKGPTENCTMTKRQQERGASGNLALHQHQRRNRQVTLPHFSKTGQEVKDRDQMHQHQQRHACACTVGVERFCQLFVAGEAPHRIEELVPTYSSAAGTPFICVGVLCYCGACFQEDSLAGCTFIWGTPLCI